MAPLPNAKVLTRIIQIAVAVLLALIAARSAGAPAPASVPVAPTRQIMAINDFVLPSDLAVVHDRIYVVDGGDHRVVVMALDGTRLFSFGGHGNGPGQLEGPVGITTLPAGDVVVCDSGNGRLAIFDREGQFRSALPIADGEGRAARPIDAAFNAARQTLYITDGSNHKVLSYSTRGQFQFEWGARGNLPGEFRYPANIAIGPARTVYVVDAMNTRVQQFTEAGSNTGAIGDWGVLPGRLFRPKGVALDDAGRIYIADSYLDVIQVFEGKRFLYALGDGEGQPRRFESPGGIAIHEGKLYVTEMFGRKVGVYSLP